MNFEELKEHVALLPYEEAVAAITAYLNEHPDSTDALTLRGMKHFGAGKRALAINDYHAALAIDPDCKARLALQSANDILDFYNKDLFNP
ncbi:MAG: hypothetical protein HDS25_02925 [Bacteroides sp.]|nr:hypothetical protein [Bacteroides sp.]